MRRSFLRVASQIKHSGARRKWETAVADVLSQKSDNKEDRILAQHQRVYNQHGYVPVEDVFPLADSSRWADQGPLPERKVPNPGGVERYVTKVAIVGPPNAGKSSLINCLTTEHVSAASKKEGTTKTWIKGITTVHDTQLVILDTPGIFHVAKPKDRERHLHHTYAAWDALMSADVCLLVLPVGLGFIRKEVKAVMREVLFKAGKRDLPCLLVLSKIDQVDGPISTHLYKELRAEIQSQFEDQFAKVFECSTTKYRGVLDLKDYLCQYGKQAEWKYYPQQKSDLTDADRVGELFAEMCFRHLPHEIPHLMTNRIIGWTEKDSHILVDVEVFFDRPAYMVTFYTKLASIKADLKKELQSFMKKRVQIEFHCFVTPGGIKR